MFQYCLIFIWAQMYMPLRLQDPLLGEHLSYPEFLLLLGLLPTAFLFFLIVIWASLQLYHNVHSLGVGTEPHASLFPPKPSCRASDICRKSKQVSIVSSRPHPPGPAPSHRRRADQPSQPGWDCQPHASGGFCGSWASKAALIWTRLVFIEQGHALQAKQIPKWAETSVRLWIDQDLWASETPALFLGQGILGWNSLPVIGYYKNRRGNSCAWLMKGCMSRRQQRLWWPHCALKLLYRLV